MRAIKRFLREQGLPIQVTPKIKRAVVVRREIHICPHCRQEIREKSTVCKGVNGVYYCYHRPCKDKAPIESFSEADVNDTMDKMKCRSSFYGP